MSVLARLNPLTPLALITALGIGVSFLFAPLPTLALHLSVVTLLLAAGAGLRGVVISHLTFTPFAVGVLATNAVSRPGAVLAHAGPLMITDEGVAVGMALALRVLVVAVPAVAVASVLDPTRLVTAAMQHLRLTPSVGFAVLTAHRMLGAMPQQWSTLLAAGRSRAPLDRRGRPKLGVRGYGRAAFGLLVGGIRRGEQIAGALQVRGLRSTRRTMRLQVPFVQLDAVAAVVAVVVCGTATGLVLVL